MDSSFFQRYRNEPKWKKVITGWRNKISVSKQVDASLAHAITINFFQATYRPNRA